METCVSSSRKWEVEARSLGGASQAVQGIPHRLGRVGLQASKQNADRLDSQVGQELVGQEPSGRLLRLLDFVSCNHTTFMLRGQQGNGN